MVFGLNVATAVAMAGATSRPLPVVTLAHIGDVCVLS